MLAPELLKKIRHIELRTKKILRGSLSGDYRTKKKGFGLEFEQLSEYQFGDDIRFIDWKSSARMNKLLIKEYHEERNRTIMLIVDGSLSHFYGSKNQLKHEQVAEVASIIALAGSFQKDSVGLIIVTDEVECYIPPKSGRKHIHALVEKLFTFKPHAKNTKLSVGLKQLMKIKSHGTFSFVISDFIDDNFERDFAIVAKNHELVAIRCMDEFEQKIPAVGFIELEDIETGEQVVVNTQDSRVLNYFNIRKQSLEKVLKKGKIQILNLVSGEDYIDTLISFFMKRLKD